MFEALLGQRWSQFIDQLIGVSSDRSLTNVAEQLLEDVSSAENALLSHFSCLRSNVCVPVRT